MRCRWNDIWERACVKCSGSLTVTNGVYIVSFKAVKRFRSIDLGDLASSGCHAPSCLDWKESYRSFSPTHSSRPGEKLEHVILWPLDVPEEVCIWARPTAQGSWFPHGAHTSCHIVLSLPAPILLALNISISPPAPATQPNSLHLHVSAHPLSTAYPITKHPCQTLGSLRKHMRMKDTTEGW